jgi:hypothetical protein
LAYEPRQDAQPIVRWLDAANLKLVRIIMTYVSFAKSSKAAPDVQTFHRFLCKD